MHSLKPTGDNIAQEFYKLMSKKSLEKVATVEPAAGLVEDPAAGLVEDPAEVEAQNIMTELEKATQYNEGKSNIDIFQAIADDLQTDLGGDLGGAGFLTDDDDMPKFENNATDHLEDMLIDDNSDGMLGEGMSMINAAQDALDGAIDATASEQKVLGGLAKIASSLRAKGEAFAADVVEATANSIADDLKKDSVSTAKVISGLEKVARELYAKNDALSGDMVALTICKLKHKKFAGFPRSQMGGMDDMLKEMEKAEKADGDRSLYAKSKVDIHATVKACLEEIATLGGNAQQELETYSKYGVHPDSPSRTYRVELMGPPEGQIYPVPMG